MKVIDNFLTVGDYNNILSILTSNNFPWYYNEKTCSRPEEENEIDGFQFIHGFMDGGTINSSFYDYLQPLIYETENIFNFSRKIIKAKANFSTIDVNIGSHNHRPIHTDKDFGVTAIYYVNDADGDTIIFDDKMIEVSPKANRLVYFDSQLKHCYRTATKNNKRIVINLNLN